MEFSRHSSARVALAVALVAVAEMTVAANLDSGSQPVIVVRVDNLGGVRADHLQVAEDRASAIFSRIGVRMRWVDQEETVRDGLTPTFTIVIVGGKKGSRLRSAFVDALGLATPTTRRAHIFYDRVAALNAGTQRTIPSLLGHIIAHELGHLVVAPPGHSVDGIMRPELETKSWALRTFTGTQAREIRSRLADGTNVDANRAPLNRPGE